MARAVPESGGEEGPAKSVVMEVSEGARRFSSFQDLLNWHVKRGDVASWEDALARRPQVIHNCIFEWIRQGQVGCQFAVHLAMEPAKSKWPSELVPPGFDVVALNERIDQLALKSEGLQLVFLGVVTAEGAARLMVKLCEAEGSRWSCYEGAWDYGEEGEGTQGPRACVPAALRWNPAGGDYTSLTLGIAPFETMPFTRRFVGAPFTTLVLRAGPPIKRKPWTDAMLGKVGAHLAHMDDRCGRDGKARKILKRMTQAEVLTLTSNDFDSVARAQTTFAFPQECRSILSRVSMGVAPKKRKGKGRKHRARARGKG